VSSAAYAFDLRPDFAEVVVGLPRAAAKDVAGCVADRHRMGSIGVATELALMCLNFTVGQE
jgi:hypothetical protein